MRHTCTIYNESTYSIYTAWWNIVAGIQVGVDKGNPANQQKFPLVGVQGRVNRKDNMIKNKRSSDAGCDKCPTVESAAHLIVLCQKAQH